MWLLGIGDVPALSLGAALLGSGGGGSTNAGAVLAERALELNGPLPIIEPSELPPDARVSPVGIAGSVTVFEEKPAAGPEMARAVRALEHHTGHRLEALMSFEAAGVNAPLAVAAAASVRVALLDADAMGRALPRIDQMVFTLAGLPVSPLVLVDDRGSVVVLDRLDPARAERFARSVIVAMGGWAVLALAPLRAADLPGHVIPGSIRRALDLGRRLQTEPLETALAAHGGRRLFHGRVVEVVRSGEGGVAEGSAVLQSLEDHRRLGRVEFQAENLLFLEDGRIRACVPDLIGLLDPDRRLPVSCEDVRHGLELDVVAFPAAEAWRTAEGLRLVGPSAFGYELPYVPLGGER